MTEVEIFQLTEDLDITKQEGGSKKVHTDNVNIPSYWDYLMFSCLASAKAGGETILVDSLIRTIHKELSKNFKEAKKILEKNFYCEKIVLIKELYKAPIISYDKMNQPRFKFLRPYLESAHIKAKKNLSNKQLYALDVLDALLESNISTKIQNAKRNIFLYFILKSFMVEVLFLIP